MLHRVASSEALRGAAAHQAGLWRGLAPSNGLAPYRTAAASLSRYVAETCQGSAPGLSQLSAGLQRGSAQVLRALSGSASAAPQPRSNPAQEQLELDLDWRPTLTRSEQIICWVLPAAICCIVYAFTAPPALSIPYGTCIGVLFGVLLVWVRAAIVEGMYKSKERLERELGDPDSIFSRLDNILVHIKAKDGTSTANSSTSSTNSTSSTSSRGRPLGVHCYHGFGSNTWSWSRCQGQLAQQLGALVTAHDMPGFGLTERPTDMSAYLLSFNARLGRLVLDNELSTRGLLTPAAADAVGASTYPHASVHEDAAGSAPAAAQAAAGGKDTAPAADAGPAAEVKSPSDVAKAAKDQGLETPLMEGAAAAAQGDIVGAVKAAGQTAATAVTGTSSSGKQQEQEAVREGLVPSGPASAAGGAQKVQRVLMGHSLGASCAALELLSDPGAYAALILVDPAILSMGPSGKDRMSLEQVRDSTSFVQSLAAGDTEKAAATAAGYMTAGSSALSSRAASSGISSSAASSTSGSSVDLEVLAGEELQKQDSVTSRAGSATSSSNGATAPSSTSTSSRPSAGPTTVAGEPVTYYKSGPRVGAAWAGGQAGSRLLGDVFERVQALLQAGVLMTMVLILSLLRPVIMMGLRSAVRSKRFWQSGLQQAVFDKSKVDEEMVNAYRLPQLVRGWEDGMLQFLVARLSGVPSAASGGASGLEDTKLAERLAEVVNKHRIPVLIVHGQADKMVPVENSFRLAKSMANARVAVLKRSGHCPQEELPEAFAEVVGKFLEAVVARNTSNSSSRSSGSGGASSSSQAS